MEEYKRFRRFLRDGSTARRLRGPKDPHSTSREESENERSLHGPKGRAGMDRGDEVPKTNSFPVSDRMILI